MAAKKNPLDSETLKKAGKAALVESRELGGNLIGSTGRLLHHLGEIVKPKRNPRKNIITGQLVIDFTKIYSVITKEASEGRARNASELGAMTGMGLTRARKALEALEANEMACEVGQDADGPCWAPSNAAVRVPNRNPSPAAVAEKKAAAWNQNKKLTTKAKKIRHTLPESYIDVGDIVAIEYRSKKFDGRTRVYRHEVTKKRALHVSTDGSTFIVKPGFKITKRGIEG